MFNQRETVVPIKIFYDGSYIPEVIEQLKKLNVVLIVLTPKTIQSKPDIILKDYMQDLNEGDIQITPQSFSISEALANLEDLVKARINEIYEERVEQCLYLMNTHIEIN